MNKPIINGIDVSKYFINHYDNEGKLYAVEYKGNPLELQNAIKHLQEENEELKRFKKEISKTIVLPDIEEEATNKYKQALEEIREQYVNKAFFKCDKLEEECPCHNCIILGQLDRVQNIVKIIDEVLNDRD